MASARLGTFGQRQVCQSAHFALSSLTLQAVATGAGKELNGLKLESFDKIESCVWKYGIGGGWRRDIWGKGKRLE